jgi:hypothetical protein
VEPEDQTDDIFRSEVREQQMDRMCEHRLRVGQRRLTAQDVRAPQRKAMFRLPGLMKNSLRIQVGGDEIRMAVEQPIRMPDDTAQTARAMTTIVASGTNSRRHGRTPFYGSLSNHLSRQ